MSDSGQAPTSGSESFPFAPKSGTQPKTPSLTPPPQTPPTSGATPPWAPKDTPAPPAAAPPENSGPVLQPPEAASPPIYQAPPVVSSSPTQQVGGSGVQQGWGMNAPQQQVPYTSRDLGAEDLRPANNTGVILMEEEIDPSERKTRYFLVISIIGLSAVLLISVGIGVFSFVKDVLKPPPTKTNLATVGPNVMSDYVQTRQRLQMLGMLNVQYRDQTGDYASAIGGLEDVGAAPGMFSDSWGERIKAEPERIISSGMDREFDTEDDIWFENDSMQISGYFPKLNMPGGIFGGVPPEAQTAINNAMQMQEELQRNQMNMQRQIMQAEMGYDYEGQLNTRPPTKEDWVEQDFE